MTFKLILLESDAVSLAKRLLNINAVSAILTFKLILLFSALESDLNLVVIAVESPLNLNVIAVESLLSFVAIAFESIKIFALSIVVKSVESDLNLVVIAVESPLNLNVIAVESFLSFAVMTVESNLILVDRARESLYIFALTSLMLSASAVLDPVTNALIRLDNETVSVPIRSVTYCVFANKPVVGSEILLTPVVVMVISPIPLKVKF